MDTVFTYLFMGIFFNIIWMILFFLSNKKKIMIQFSFIGAILGPITDILYTIDWWRPLTITGTRIGFEAALAGWGIAGIAIFFAKKGKQIHFSTLKPYVLIGLLTLFGVFFLSNSFIATMAASIVLTVFLFKKDPTIIKTSLISGIFMTTCAAAVYFALSIITPGWIEQFWIFENVPDIIILGLPLDDVFWYFFAGTCMSAVVSYTTKK